MQTKANAQSPCHLAIVGVGETLPLFTNPSALAYGNRRTGYGNGQKVDGNGRKVDGNGQKIDGCGQELLPTASHREACLRRHGVTNVGGDQHMQAAHDLAKALKGSNRRKARQQRRRAAIAICRHLATSLQIQSELEAQDSGSLQQMGGVPH